jgi:hypothetical protein
MIIRPQRRNRSVASIQPAWPARLATARLRRTRVRPILARPPVRAIQACVRRSSCGTARPTGLTESTEISTKEQTHWLVLTRSSVAGFNPIRDS